MSNQTEISLNELEKIADENGGVLVPEKVVEFARNPATSLHSRFLWDDTEAGKEYRLIQARGIIRRVTITVVKQEQVTKQITLDTTRAYQSRPSNRSGGGYEKVQDIMTDPAKRNEMITQVLKELQSYRNTYSDLQELADVWKEVDKVAA